MDLHHADAIFVITDTLAVGKAAVEADDRTMLLAIVSKKVRSSAALLVS